MYTFKINPWFLLETRLVNTESWRAKSTDYWRSAYFWKGFKPAQPRSCASPNEANHALDLSSIPSRTSYDLLSDDALRIHFKASTASLKDVMTCRTRTEVIEMYLSMDIFYDDVSRNKCENVLQYKSLTLHCCVAWMTKTFTLSLYL